jgi:Kef-type K+ transport system membrane component KefB
MAAFMMPLFFLMLGARTNIRDLALNTHWITVVTVIVLALLVKMVFIFAVSKIYRMPLMDGLSLALLMNTKGITPLIILYSAMDRLVSYLTK